MTVSYLIYFNNRLSRNRGFLIFLAPAKVCMIQLVSSVQIPREQYSQIISPWLREFCKLILLGIATSTVTSNWPTHLRRSLWVWGLPGYTPETTALGTRGYPFRHTLGRIASSWYLLCSTACSSCGNTFDASLDNVYINDTSMWWGMGSACLSSGQAGVLWHKCNPWLTGTWNRLQGKPTQRKRSRSPWDQKIPSS